MSFRNENNKNLYQCFFNDINTMVSNKNHRWKSVQKIDVMLCCVYFFYFHSQEYTQSKWKPIKIYMCFVVVSFVYFVSFRLARVETKQEIEKKKDERNRESVCVCVRMRKREKFMLFDCIRISLPTLNSPFLSNPIKTCANPHIQTETYIHHTYMWTVHILW